MLLFILFTVFQKEQYLYLLICYFHRLGIQLLFSFELLSSDKSNNIKMLFFNNHLTSTVKSNDNENTNHKG